METPPDNPPVAEELFVAPIAPAREPFWGWIDLLMVVGLLVAMILFLSLTAAGAMALRPSLVNDPAPVYLFVQVGFYAAIYFTFFLTFFFRYDRPVWSSLCWRRTVSNSTLALIGIGGALLSPAVSLVASLLHTPEVRMDVMDQLEKDPIILALFGVMSFTVAPLFEEMLFRGFLQPLFSRTFGTVSGILLTSVLFGSLHAVQYKFVWQYVAAVSCVGIALGVVRYRTGSIIPSTVMHACFNAVAATGLFFNHK